MDVCAKLVIFANIDFLNVECDPHIAIEQCEIDNVTKITPVPVRIPTCEEQPFNFTSIGS